MTFQGFGIGRLTIFFPKKTLPFPARKLDAKLQTTGKDELRKQRRHTSHNVFTDNVNVVVAVRSRVFVLNEKHVKSS